MGVQLQWGRFISEIFMFSVCFDLILVRHSCDWKDISSTVFMRTLGFKILAQCPNGQTLSIYYENMRMYKVEHLVYKSYLAQCHNGPSLSFILVFNLDDDSI